MLQCHRAQGANSQDDVRRECDQFRCVSAVALNIIPAPSDIYLHTAALNPTQLLQHLLERHDASLTSWIIGNGVHEHTDPSHMLGLLRANHERPCSGTAEQRNELAPPHVPSPRLYGRKTLPVYRGLNDGNESFS